MLFRSVLFFVINRIVFSDRMTEHIPILGKAQKRSEYADIAENIAMFYSCGIKPDVALEYCAKSVKRSDLKEKLLWAAAHVREGNPLSEALSIQNAFPIEMINQIRVGEKTGDIDRMLRLIAEYYREDEKLTMEMISSLIR